jgi:methionine-rich copper-binding protein CopC
MRRPLSIRLAAAAAVLPGATMLFHLTLVRSDPADAAVLAQAPAAVQLWFSQRAEVAVTRVRLLGPRGTVALGPLQRAATPAGGARATAAARTRVDGLVAPVRGPMPPGAYTLEWRTMAADGHPVAGRLAFRVGAPATTR